MNALDTIRNSLKETGDWYIDFPPPNAESISQGVPHYMLVLHKNKDLNIDWANNQLLKHGIAVQPLPKDEDTPNVYPFVVLVPKASDRPYMFEDPMYGTTHFIKWILNAEMVAVNKADLTNVIRAWQANVEQRWPLPYFYPSLEIYERVEEIKQMTYDVGWCFDKDDVIQPGRWVQLKLIFPVGALPNMRQTANLLQGLGHDCIDPSTGFFGLATSVGDWSNYEDEMVLLFNPGTPVSASQIEELMFESGAVEARFCTNQFIERTQYVPDFVKSTEDAISASGESVRSAIDSIGDVANTMSFVAKGLPTVLWLAIGGASVFGLFTVHRMFAGRSKSKTNRRGEYAKTKK